MKTSLFKVLILGKSNVGKTTIMKKYITNYDNSHITIGVDFQTQFETINGSQIGLQIWDVCSEKNSLGLFSTFCKNVRAVMLVYNFADKKSFEEIDFWYNLSKKHTKNKNLPIILIGNKSDLDSRKVAYSDGFKKSKRYGLQFFETNAILGNNINNAFFEIANILINYEHKGIDCCLREDFLDL